jgi:hypothetical protein
MDIKSKLLLMPVLIGLAQASAQAQSITVNYGAGPGQRDVLYNGSSFVPDGNYVKVGFFSAGFDVAANANNLTALSGAWNELGSTTIKTLFGTPGLFGDQGSTTDPKFDAQKICLWITQTVNNGAPTASFDNLLGYGVFSSANWLFPQSTAIPPGNTTSIDSSQVTEAYYGSFDTSHLMLTPVPEPSTYALLALGIAPVVIMKVRKARRTQQTAAKS